jgi:hypothetical protein
MQKNPHAVALGRKGGKKGGVARAAKLSAEQRSASARRAVLARWKRAAPVGDTARVDRQAFFANPSLDDLALQAGVPPIADLSALAGVFPADFDVEAMVTDIYQERRRR